MKLHLSQLPKTWILDIDGTLVIHNGHLQGIGDRLLPGVKDFFDKIPRQDIIVLMSARKEDEKTALESFLTREGIRYNYLLLDMPHGERILVNDKKPSGLITAYAVNKERDASLNLEVCIDPNL